MVSDLLDVPGAFFFEQLLSLRLVETHLVSRKRTSLPVCSFQKIRETVSQARGIIDPQSQIEAGAKYGARPAFLLSSHG